MVEQTWEFVRAADTDIPEILELTRQIHGDSSGLADAGYVRWLTKDNPAGHAINWVAKEKATGQIIANVLGIAVRFKVVDYEGTVYTPLNLLVHPDFRRRGIISDLTQRALEDYREHGAGFAYGSPGPALKKAWLNFQPQYIVGQPPLLLRPFDVQRLLGGLGLPGKPLHGLVAVGYKLLRPLLGDGQPSAVGTQLQVETIAKFDESFDRFWAKVKHKYPTMMVRDARFLQWRYKDIPLKQYQCLACRSQDGEVKGYIVFRNTYLANVETGMILDLLVEPSRQGQLAGLSLVATATKVLEQAGSAVAVCRMMPHTEEYRILRRQGYLPCPARLDPHPITIIDRRWLDTIPLEALTKLDHWFFTLGDWGIDAFSA